MHPLPLTLSQPPSVQVCATLEIIPTILYSLWALTLDEQEAHQAPLDPAFSKQVALLSPDQHEFNRLLFAAFGSVLLQVQASEPTSDFGDYLDTFAARPIAQFHVQLQHAVQQIRDPILQGQTQTLLHDPATLQDRIVGHLRRLWETLFAAEWKRHSTSLAGMTRSLNDLLFSQPRWQAINGYEALRFLLQTEPSDTQLAQVADVRYIHLLLSPHLLGFCTLAPYIEAHDRVNDTLWVLRKMDPQWMRRDPIRRAEILLPMGALADETRLRILELLNEHGEQRAQELIAELESSQGNVSRHLKQLVGTNLLRERRVGDANKHYSFDATGMYRLFFLLRQLFSNQNAQLVSQEQQNSNQLEQMRANASPILHSFLDAQGRITRWSSKLKDQRAMLEYLYQKFEPERAYSEKEVNTILQQWYLDADFVLIRRGMVEASLLKRTKDGARYWRD